MKYFYDIKINFDDNYLYEFYEWQKKDNIEYIKKIPMHIVSNKSMKDFIIYDFKVENSFLDKILNQTENNNGGKIKYASIFADSKTALVVEFDNLGNAICKSKLLLGDELNIIEIGCNFKKTNINYILKDKKNKIRKVLRQEAEIKKILNLEIDTLYKNKDLLKLKYLYYELFNIEKNDIYEIYQDLKKKLKQEIDKEIFKIYEIIRLSYKAR